MYLFLLTTALFLTSIKSVFAAELNLATPASTTTTATIILTGTKGVGNVFNWDNVTAGEAGSVTAPNANWSATVPLKYGKNNILLTSIDTAGAVATKEVVITRILTRTGDSWVRVIKPGAASVRKYEKFEADFDIDTVAENNFYVYDTNAPYPLERSKGVNVSALVEQPDGKVVEQPMFFRTLISKVNGVYINTTTKVWTVRLTPRMLGVHKFKIKIVDGLGTNITSVNMGQFVGVASNDKGFVKVSSADTRYFEHETGEQFWPVGPLNANQTTNPSGLNFERIWFGGYGIYSSNWAHWISSASGHGNEGWGSYLQTGKDSTGKKISYGDSEVSYYLHTGAGTGISGNTKDGYYIRISGTEDETFAGVLEVGREYQMSMRVKTEGFNGAKFNSALSNYGFTLKVVDPPAGDWAQMQDPSIMKPYFASSKNAFTPINTNTDWHTVVVKFTATKTSNSMFLVLDNMATGKVFIDNMSIRPVTNSGLGAEIVRQSKASSYEYIEDRPAADIDFMLDQAKQKDLYYKFVVHDKNDKFAELIDLPTNEFTFNATGDWRYYNSTRVKWLLKNWYRYIAARWGYSTNVQSWELNNEGPPHVDEHFKAADDFGAFMKKTNIYPQMVTTSGWCCAMSDSLSKGYWNTYRNIDFVDVHQYTDHEPWHILVQSVINTLSQKNNDLKLAMLRDTGYAGIAGGYSAWTARTVNGVDKPFMWSESGMYYPNDGAEKTFLTNTNSGVWYRNLLWAQLSPGGMTSSGYWFSEHFKPINVAKYSSIFSKFVSNLEFNKGGYIDSLANSSTKIVVSGKTYTGADLRKMDKEIYAVAQNNLNTGKGYVWIQNAKSNWYNEMQKVSPPVLGASIEISGLTPGSYKVDEYDTTTGAVNTTTKSVTSGGNLLIAVANLNTDRAIAYSTTSGVLPTSTPVAPTATPVIVNPTIAPTVAPSPTSTVISTDLNNDGKTTTADVDYLIENYVAKAYTIFDFARISKAITSAQPPVTVAPTAVPSAAPTIAPTVVQATPTSSGPVPTGLPVTSTDWTQYGYNSQHYSSSPVSITALGNKVSWAWIDENTTVRNWLPNKDGRNSIVDTNTYKKFPIQFGPGVQPVVVGGVVYIGADNGKLYAIDAATGQTRWSYDTGRPIFSTAAYGSGILVVTSTNGIIYGLDIATQKPRWTLNTEASIVASPVISGNNVYVGSRNGTFYNVHLLTGSVLWSYKTRVEPINNASPFNQAGIVAPAVISEDGQKVVFVAENMYMYGLDAGTGAEAWKPKKMNGRSTWMSIPVIYKGKVMVYTAADRPGVENKDDFDNVGPALESRLEALPANIDPATEKQAISKWLAENPAQKFFYVVNVSDGSEPYVPAMGRVSGELKAAFPPTISLDYGPLMYWRTKLAGLFNRAASFGLTYCSDISGMDMNTGDRVGIEKNNVAGGCPEVDNGFWLTTTGNNQAVMAQNFRGLHIVDLATGSRQKIFNQWYQFDGGNNANQFQFWLYGNAGTTNLTNNTPGADIRPKNADVHSSKSSPASVAQVNGKGVIFVAGMGVPLMAISP